MNIQRRTMLAAGIASMTAFSLPALAAGWPDRPIRLISPYGPGGSNDILSRSLGDALGKRLKQNIVIENKAGAGTRIANELVARAAPDGYTVLHAAAPIAIGGALYSKLPYDAETSFAPVTLTAIAPLFLVVNAKAPYKTLKEFIAYGKAQSKGLTFGSPGIGSAPHLTAELLMRTAGASGIVVQYRGDAAAYTELLAGRIDATLTAISTAIPHIQAGKLRVLAVANEERSPLYPQVPTMRESGYPQAVGYGWFGLLVPAGTPAEIVQRLNAETNAVLKLPNIRKQAEAAGLQLRGDTPAEFAAFIDNETKKWSKVIKEAHITGE